VQFTVELNGVSIDKRENRGKDVIVRWKMFDGFNSSNKFWTDSNGLGMMERTLSHKQDYNPDAKWSNISSNYYPVDSAIFIRDQTN